MVAPWLVEPSQPAAEIEERFDRAAPIVVPGSADAWRGLDRRFGGRFESLTREELQVPFESLAPEEQRAILDFDTWSRDEGKLPDFSCESHEDVTGPVDVAQIAKVALAALRTVTDPNDPRLLAVARVAHDLVAGGRADDVLAGVGLLSSLELLAAFQQWSLPAGFPELRPEPQALRRGLARDARCWVDGMTGLEVDVDWSPRPGDWGIAVFWPARERRWNQLQWAQVLDEQAWGDLEQAEANCVAAAASRPTSLFIGDPQACSKIVEMRRWFTTHATAMAGATALRAG